jgi:hypothetical protein
MKLKLLVTIIITSILSTLFLIIYFDVYNDNKQEILNEEYYYITSLLYNNELILDNWIDELKKFLLLVSKEKVYISIVENKDSKDKTKEKLATFQKWCNENNYKNTFFFDRIVTWRSRIQFLSELRYLALLPLFDLKNWNYNKTKIVFISDVIYKAGDLKRLILTNNGDYDIACPLDFVYRFYDFWITR